MTPPAPSDLISRQLANTITNRLAEIHNLVRVGAGSTADIAAKSLEDLARYIWRFAESVEQTKERASREQN